MAPHAPSRSTGFALDVFVLFTVSGPGIAVADQPFPNVFAIASHSATYTVIGVVALDRNQDVLATDRSNQGTFDTLALGDQ